MPTPAAAQPPAPVAHCRHVAAPPPYGAESPSYGSAPVAGAADGTKKNKMGMGTGIVVGASSGLLGSLALAGGASYLRGARAGELGQ